MVSVVQMAGKWYAVQHTGDHVRSDQTNIISSYRFNNKESAESYAETVLKGYAKEAANE